MKRIEFLKLFFQALRARDISIKEVSSTYVDGTVIFDPLDSEELQDFRWNFSEANAIPDELTKLVKLIADQQLLRSDKLNVTQEKLTNLFNSSYDLNSSLEDIERLLKQLFAIRVEMVDDDKETDFFFIHQ